MEKSSASTIGQPLPPPEPKSILRIVVEWFLGIQDEEDGIYTKRHWVADEYKFRPSPTIGQPLPPPEPKSILRIVTEVVLGAMTIFAIGYGLFLIGYLLFVIAPGK